MKNGRKCHVCGKEYEYCPNCDSYNGFPRWMFLFCSANCNEIFNTVSDFDAGKIDAKTAKRRLDKCNIKKAEPLCAGTKEGIQKILSQVKSRELDSDKFLTTKGAIE